ncbi:MAG: hypothetical protein VW397_07330 [Candidatus Margulisiibacteriota bacterium]
MKHKQWNILSNEIVFELAEKNMKYDEALLENLAPNQTIERFYIWKQPGITFSYKQECPLKMHHLDASKRITGGGIVFHSPGDIVFSITGWKNDPNYPVKMKEKLQKISSRVSLAIQNTGVRIDSESKLSSKDMDYCQTYPTPFEISINGQKVLGLTIRQFRLKWLIQGVIHTKPTHISLREFTQSQIKSNLDEKAILLNILNYSK